ncbi:hypothetical protein Rhopal_000112-T1 [Rhodotorula paludigena]|uniref:Uncharacterized protein n=1 Tax=Rhodotorula paludigena TaxID=86838 RepID=A0AAV5GCX1_9BASI|nr:hypothetical protein Rhopal_000112-T1 [Rhodotorula paludigena]
MAKSSVPPPDPGKPWSRLIITLLILAAVAYGAVLAFKAITEGIDSAKKSLEAKGVKVNSTGASVKTDRRAYTQEETEDRLQSHCRGALGSSAAAEEGLMKGWKNTTFNVPWTLNKVTNLGGSKHDKNKQEWEKTHGPKPHKTHIN